MDSLAEGRWQQIENKANCTVWNAYPQEDLTATWTGKCLNGKAEGYGEKVWRFLRYGKWEKARYKGTMRDGKDNGLGVLVWANGDRYVGSWQNGKQEGHGIMEFAAGNKCEGSWLVGKLLGSGEGWHQGEGKVMKCYVDSNKISFSD